MLHDNNSKVRLTFQQCVSIENDMQQTYPYERCLSCSPKGPCIDKFSETLRSSGGRLTKERISLLSIVCNMNRHFHAYDLVERLSEQGYRTSLATVYRTLTLMVHSGIVRKVTPGDETAKGGVWYEHAWREEHHDHLVCLRCKKVVEFAYPAIEILQEAVAREHGFTLVGHHLELTGLCESCRKTRDEKGMTP